MDKLSDFTLKSDTSNVSGIVTDTAIVLINDVFQTSGATNEFTITEDSALVFQQFHLLVLEVQSLLM